jgi:esterase/lipase superfamily enzyme
MFRVVSLISFLLLAACAPRGEIAFGIAPADATQQQIWVAQFRPTDDPQPGDRSPPRPDDMQFSRYVISIPPTHQTGQIEWPQGRPNGNVHFLTLSQDALPALRPFASAVAKSNKENTKTIVLFVHGYNSTHGEAVYQGAQIAHDFELTSPMVLFSWPSAARTIGYLYDRDSVLIARDPLEKLIVSLASQPGHRLEIVAHSMGSFLVMETLRQIETAGSLHIGARIQSLTLVSPDIDGELFYAQASALSELPRETTILAARQDQALKFSAFLTGRSNRLGSATDRTAVRDLPITVVDTSDLSEGGLSHSIPFTSARAIDLIKMLDQSIQRLGAVTDRVINLADER